MSTHEIVHASLKNTTKLIVRHHKYAWVFTFVAVLIVSGVYLKKDIVDAATYTFTQASWAGVMDSTTATHASNQTGWTKYSAKDTGVTVGTTVALTNTSYSVTDDGALVNPGFESGTTVDADSWTEATAADRVSDRAYSGSYSMKFINPSVAQLTNQTISVIANTKYTLSGWVYKDYDITSYLDLSDISEECTAGASSTLNAWQFVSCSFTTGASRTSVTVRMVVGTVATGNVWFDDISLLATTGSATGGSFGAGTNSSTAVSGTGSGASVGLMINGGTGADGAYSCASGTCSLAGATYNYTTFNISSGAIVNVPTGGSQLIINATGNVTIAGTLNVNGATGGSTTSYTGASGGAAGAGGSSGGVASGTQSGGGGGGGVYSGGNTNGYSYGGAGGGGSTGAGSGSFAGANCNAQISSGTNGVGGGNGGGGGACGSAVISATGGGNGGNGGNGSTDGSYSIPPGGNSYTTELGGSGGGGGGGSVGGGGGGGGGGGYLKIVSSGSIINTGTINANGGAGGASFNYNGGNKAAGGGGGGTIRAIAVSISNGGTISAIGGAGAGGSYGVGGGGGGGGKITATNITGNVPIVTGGPGGIGGSGTGSAGNAGTITSTYPSGTFPSSGTFTSNTIDFGAFSNLSTMSWAPTSQDANTGTNPLTFQLSSSNSSYSDGFDGASLDTTKWTTNSTAGGTASQGNGYITATSISSQSNSVGRIQTPSGAIPSGDFDIQTDFNLITFPTPSTAQNGALLNINTSGYGYVIYVVRSSTGTTYSSWTDQPTSGVFGGANVATADSSGKLRLTRVGTAITAYYWNNSSGGWTQFSQRTGTGTGTGTAYLYTSNYTTGQSLEVRFDNFIVWGANAVSTPNYYGPSGTTATGDVYTTAAGQNIWSGHNGSRYLRYKAILNTANTAYTPTLNDITINYTQYPTSATLTSSKYDTGSAGNTISGINWIGSATSSTAIIKFQMRTASTAVGLDTAVWQGPTSSSDYFTTGYQTITNSNLTGTTNRQFVQYQVTLSGNGSATPILSSVIARYVVNAPPTVSSVTASQGSTGTVTVGYTVADTDSTSETITLQYCPTGSTCTVSSDTNWVSATTVSGNVGAGVTLGSGKSITWTPTTDYASQYNGTELVRVKANDGDAANNLGYGISSAFVLDTTAPVVTVANLDSSGTQDIVNLTTTDNSAITYRLCNTADFAACASWTSITSGTATPVNWTATGAPAIEVVYLQVRDLYGNTTSRTITAPATPTNLLAADVSNPTAISFGETLSWLAVTNATSYRVYSNYTAAASTAPSSYTLLSTPSTNVYQHTITNATTSAYWYRVAAVNSNGDISNFTTLQDIGDVPDSFGTTLPDTTAPVIDTNTISVPTATLKNTSAIITFTTNELAIAKVYYGTTNYGTACSSYGAPVTTTSYVTAQSVSLTGLTASTPYYYCLKAVDTLGNPLVDPNTGVDGSVIAPLTTAGGPTITVAPQPNPFNDTSATIIWTTSTSSDSYVYYATNASVTNPKTAGSATLVSCVASVCPHSVGISGLTAGTKYYYYVKSTDGLSNTTPSAIDNFTTTIDITPPVISAIATPVTSSNAVVIVWQTDEPATTQVYYGGTAGSRPNFTTLDTTKSIYHVVTLSSATLNAKNGATDVLLSNNVLTPSTPYYYTVTSADVAGNSATSAEQTVSTPSTGNVTIVAVSVTAAPTTAGATPDTTAPTISNVKVTDITPFGATITFDTSEDANAGVEYGKDTSYGDIAGEKTFTSTHTIKLRGLTLGTEYHIKVTANDKSGNTGTGDDQTFKTTFLSENLKDMTKVENIEQFQKEIEDTIASILPSLIPPFVGRPQIADITEDGATVSFTTNIKAFPVVGFVEENLFDATKDNPYTGETSDTTEKRLNHTLALMGLKPNTAYHIQARAFSLPQVIGKSKDYTFTTKASKIVASIIERKKDSFSVVWTTLEPTSSIVEYKNIKSGRIARVTDDVKKTSHAMKIENLPPATSYEVNVSGINEKNNIVEAGASLSVMTSKDVTPPTLSGFKVANALVPGRTDRIQTIISWATDESADSVVYYEEGVGTTGDTKELSNKVEVPDLSISHNVILSSLKPGAIYRIKITSTDDSGNTGIFGPRTVITPRQTESITDIIFKNFEDSFKFLRQM